MVLLVLVEQALVEPGLDLDRRPVALLVADRPFQHEDRGQRVLTPESVPDSGSIVRSPNVGVVVARIDETAVGGSRVVDQDQTVRGVAPDLVLGVVSADRRPTPNFFSTSSARARPTSERAAGAQRPDLGARVHHGQTSRGPALPRARIGPEKRRFILWWRIGGQGECGPPCCVSPACETEREESRRAPEKKGPASTAGPLQNDPGNVLLSHAVTHAVPSALRGLTAVFGMGTGVALSLWSPGKPEKLNRRCRREIRRTSDVEHCSCMKKKSWSSLTAD